MKCESPLMVVTASLLLFLAAGCLGKLTDADKKEATDFINYLRRNVVPRAADMNAIAWDSNLEKLAQDAADQCVLKHYYDGAYAKLGENVYMGGRSNISEILLFMYLERENYNFKTGACDTTGGKYRMSTCGHYLQLVSANVILMGCAMNACPSGNLMFCEFNVGYSSPPYIAGEPGTRCHHSMATYTHNDLCYYQAIGAQMTATLKMDCRLECMNYGNKTFNDYMCLCTCPSGYYGSNCQNKLSSANSMPNDCKAQLVTCKNGGKPTMSGDKCKCVCPATHRGDACEENIQQADNSVFFYFGETAFMESFYPVNSSIWVQKRGDATVQYYMTIELNNYCLANYKLCCPNGPGISGTKFVNYADFKVTDNYPQNELDGTLKVGVHFRLPDELASQCGGSSAPYVNRQAMLAAAAKAMPGIKTFQAYYGVTAVKYN